MWELEAYEISPNQPIHRFALSDDSIEMTDFYGTRFCIIEPNAAMPPEMILKRVWLMACAPELLAALEKIADLPVYAGQEGRHNGLADQYDLAKWFARAAIAKARKDSHGSPS